MSGAGAGVGTGQEQEVYVVVELGAVCRLCLEPGGALCPAEPGLLRRAAALLHLHLHLHIQDDAKLPSKICHRCRYKCELLEEFKNMVAASQNTLYAYANIESDITPDTQLSFQEPNSQYSNEYKNNDQNKIIDANVKNIVDSTQSLSVKDEQQEKCVRNKDANVDEYPTMMVALRNNLCLLCLENCDGISLQDHVKDHLYQTTFEPYYQVKDRNILCKHCGQMFHYRFSFIDHQRQHLNIKPFKCKDEGCDLSFYSRTSWKNHLAVHAERSFICLTCGVAFKRKSDLNYHNVIHKDEGKLFPCSVCRLICKNRITYAAHAKTHKHPPKHRCKICTKHYYSPTELKRHLLSHSRDKPFLCETCGKAYYFKSTLIRHIRSSAVCREYWKNSGEIV